VAVGVAGAVLLLLMVLIAAAVATHRESYPTQEGVSIVSTIFNLLTHTCSRYSSPQSNQLQPEQRPYVHHLHQKEIGSHLSALSVQ
jgi:hypothetical protein